MTCITCGGEAVKVLYAGIPLKLCRDHDCATCWGALDFVLGWLPFNGMFIRYGDGVSYWQALRFFLFGDIRGERD